MQLVLLQGEILCRGHGGNISAGAGTNGWEFKKQERGSARGFGGNTDWEGGSLCLPWHSAAALTPHHPFHSLSEQGADGGWGESEAAGMSPCPWKHLPCCVGCSETDKAPQRTKKRYTPKMGPHLYTLWSCLLPWDSLMNLSGCSVPLAEACSGLGAVLATVIPVPAQVPLQPSCSSPLRPHSLSKPFAWSSVTQSPQAATCTLQTSCCIKD